ncbi:hypothetical protein BCR36DRAFT_587153 [Piromyces finnis]|uniref:Uncharacterized protein n=1 Tax=Piromyces finnis TaxID=1754191 RepID=A0A1Y1UWH6_9FUNG|nr:hypothetical protein BCR36DRAFT_587153 [Piromyces finnis]|eukprot:ORX42443.1 hypothetical protein BCR36DRAFT_587153 [Piromyces finnis]
MFDDFENNQEHFNKTDNDTTIIKKNQNLNKDVYNLILNEIKFCYNTTSTINKTIIDNYLSDNKVAEDKCRLKKSSTNNRSFNKILDDIYSLNISDKSCKNSNNTTIEKNKNKTLSNNNSISSKELNTRIVQKTLLSTLKTSITHKTRKRKFSNNIKSNAKQTKLNFISKKQKTI